VLRKIPTSFMDLKFLREKFSKARYFEIERFFIFHGGHFLRTFLFAAATSSFAIGAQAAPSDMIREQGLANAIATLEGQTEMSPSDQLALSGMTFLRAIETAYQTRWQVGYVSDDLPLPLFSNALSPNPSPNAIKADTLSLLFENVLNDMGEMDAILAAIPVGSDPVFELSLADVWFDINMNGTREKTEDFGKIALQTTMNPWEIQKLETTLANNPAAPNPMQATIRFDEADLHWLRAYGHVISGVSELILAFDPQPEIQKALDLREALNDQRTHMIVAAVEKLDGHPKLQALAQQAAEFDSLSPDEVQALEASFAALSSQESDLYHTTIYGEPSSRNFLNDEEHFVDMAAVFVETLRHQPDQTRVEKARNHLLAMLGHNRNFWQLIDAETDNKNEWIANDFQQSALGVELPEGTGDAWLAVLGDMEKVLQGELLVPFWRYAFGHGIDLNSWVENPSPLNVVEWFQGTSTLPYARQGEVITTKNWDEFQSLVQQQSGFLVFMLN
jgi:hypothetical protein